MRRCVIGLMLTLVLGLLLEPLAAAPLRGKVPHVGILSFPSAESSPGGEATTISWQFVPLYC